MLKELLTPTRAVVLAWVGLPLLAFALSSWAGSMEDAWRATPPTEVEETDCRIDAMMGGDNPVEVNRMHAECLERANEAYVRPRVRRVTLGFGLIVVLYAAGAGFATWRWTEWKKAQT